MKRPIDKHGLVNNQAVLDIFGGSYSDDEEDKQNTSNKNFQGIRSQESKGYSK